MNIFKRAANAVTGLLKRKKVNLNKINDTPPVDSEMNASTRSGRSSFSTLKGYAIQQLKGDAAKEFARNRWKNGGIGSWDKASKRFGKRATMYGSADAKYDITLAKAQRREKRLERHVASLEKQVKNVGVQCVGV